MKLQPQKPRLDAATRPAEASRRADSAQPVRPHQAPQAVGDVAAATHPVADPVPVPTGKPKRRPPPAPAGPPVRKPVTVPRYH